MSAHIDQATLREAVFKACNTLDAFEAMPYSTIRKETERLLNLEKKALKDRKDDITEMVFQFRNVHKLQKNKRTLSEIGGQKILKKGKYSVHETQLILSAIHDYVDANDLQMSDVCSEMREKSEKYKRHTALWDSLADLLPHRDRISIHEHAKRKLMSDTRTGSFTEEEKKRVLQMAAVYGHDWKRIANELGRMTGDIKDLYKILKTPRINSGHFTLQEAAKLIMAVKQVTGCSDKLKSFEIPYENISWIAVAQLMKNERLPLDYLRHWKVIRKNSWLGPELVAGMVTTSQQRDDDRKIIAYIAEKEPEDASEVIWSHVDSSLLTRQPAYSRWKTLCSENLLNFHLDFSGSLAFLMKKLNVLEGGVLGTEERQEDIRLVDVARSKEARKVNKRKINTDAKKKVIVDVDDDQEVKKEKEKEAEEEKQQEEVNDMVEKDNNISLAAALAAALPPPNSSSSISSTPYMFVKQEQHISCANAKKKRKDKKRKRMASTTLEDHGHVDVVIPEKKKKVKKEGENDGKSRFSDVDSHERGKNQYTKKKKKKKDKKVNDILKEANV